MSWLYSQALVEEYSEGICLDGAPSALSNGKHTQLPSWCSDKTMANCQLSQSGMTFKPLTEDLGEAVLMSFLEAFPARTLAAPAKAKASKESDHPCGNTWRESLEKFDLDTHTWKTHQCLWDEDLQPSSVILPKWGMMLSGVLWERTTLPRLTSGTGSGSWPTPTCQEVEHPDAELTDTGRRLSKDGQSSHSLNLADSVKSWPTPQANEDAAGTPAGNMQKMLGNDPRVRGETQEEWSKGALNPTWVELLMGWPKNWTSISHIDLTEHQKWLMSWHGTKTNRKQELSELREHNDPKEVRQEAGGLRCVSTEEILLSFLCEYEEGCDQGSVVLQGQEVSKEKLRVLWDWGEVTGSPYRRELQKRCGGKLSDFVRLVSQVSPSYGRPAWQNGTWEFATARVATGIKHRVGRLKAIGNGQVPQVAAMAWNILSK